MPRKVTKQDPVKKKEKPEANPIKSKRLSELKEKLNKAEEKLKSNPNDQGALRVKKTLEELFAREHERGYC